MIDLFICTVSVFYEPAFEAAGLTHSASEPAGKLFWMCTVAHALPLYFSSSSQEQVRSNHKALFQSE